jgi:eukaryotic-like serine/threonine-protein kinase
MSGWQQIRSCECRTFDFAIDPTYLHCISSLTGRPIFLYCGHWMPFPFPFRRGIVVASLIGQTVSHYKILEKLGGGGMGVVYKAEDTHLKRTVALKFLPAAFSLDPDAKARFRQEAEAASALDHPNICTVHDIDETADGQIFISMACYEGETLKKRIERGPLQLHDAIDIALQVARGLQAAHEAGMVHRDVKPANIMVTVKGQVKILDFGLAKLAGQAVLTKTGSTVGTAAYVSPEQARGEEVDRRSDIFSLGVVLYEMITGHRPFRGEHEAAITYSLMNETPEPLARYKADVPDELQRVVDKSLAKERAERYQHIDEMMVDLRRAQQESPSTTESKKRKRRLPLLIGGGIALVVLAILAYIFVLPKPRPTADKSVAVLPFLNLSAGGPNAYFAAGLHDELLTQLSKVAALKVISRTSVMGYEGTKTPLRQIARELGVGSVVEGSVQVVGDRLRVNVQLIDATTDAHLWAERYDRTLDDAFAIQSEVARQIVAAVGGVLSSAEQGRLTAVPTANAEAYRLYMHGREYHIRPGYLRQNLDSAQQLYEKAVALDPSFALAHVALADVHGYIYWFRYDPSPARASRVREEAETALRLAPNLPQAHVAIGDMLYVVDRDWRHAMDEYAIALRDLPNDAGLWAKIGYVHRRLGEWEKVFEALGKATQLNPLVADLYEDLGGESYLAVRRYADAIRSFDRALIVAPNLHAAAIWRGFTYVLWHGQLDTLRTALDRIPSDAELAVTGVTTAWRANILLWERNADSLLLLLQNPRVTFFDYQIWFMPTALYAGWAHQLRGDRRGARAAFEQSRVLLDSVMKERPDDWRLHVSLGLTLAGLGRKDDAVREASWLQQSEVYRGDALDRTYVAEARARILAQAGEPRGALDEIERLVAGPSYVSAHLLRLDPVWEPLRSNPRFQALLSKGDRIPVQ